MDFSNSDWLTLDLGTWVRWSENCLICLCVPMDTGMVAGKVTRLWRALTALEAELVLFPAPPQRFTTACNCSSRGSNAFFWLLWIPDTTWYIYIHTGKIPMNLKINLYKTPGLLSVPGTSFSLAPGTSRRSVPFHLTFHSMLALSLSLSHNLRVCVYISASFLCPKPPSSQCWKQRHCQHPSTVPSTERVPTGLRQVPFKDRSWD